MIIKVIILDLMMPNLDGFTFMSTLAENDPGRLKRIIVTSAASPAVIREKDEGRAVRRAAEAVRHLETDGAGEVVHRVPRLPIE